ncbi:ribosomal-protein-alanine acetyltransferase [Bacteroidales bacterium Barb4]|nr:ribosomal-protein-alanine acetyltransferase [Bacteroidales bacterium Barb4]
MTSNLQIEYINQHHCFFQDVISLGKKHSSTLGFMPDGGFIDHAQKKFIIIAHDKTELIGYLMFRAVNRLSRLSIVHLCVKDEFRGKGVTTKLLDALREKYQTTFTGVSLSCRVDYLNATALWQRYGFVSKGKKRSRSIEEHYLYKWWYDFNRPDLFSIANESSLKIKALLDVNIIIKLRDNDIKQDISQDPRPLLADWLTEEVDYFYSPELFNEIARDKDNERAERTRRFLVNFEEVRFNIEEKKKVSDSLNTIITRNTDNDKSDRIQLASAIVSDVPYFITLDKGILEKKDTIEKQHEIQIFSPQEFILEIDQLLNKEEYYPSRLKGVTFHSIAKVSNAELNTYIDTFLSKSNSEKKSSFYSIVYTEASKINTSKIKVIKQNNDAIAFFAYEYVNSELIVSFMRLVDTDQKQTLFMQLVSDFINKAIINGLSQIMIKEIYFSANQKLVLVKMGFEDKSGTWIKYVFNKVIESSQFSKLNYDFLDNSMIETLQIVDKGEKQKNLLNLEHKYFPLKFSDLDIPCYIIPIKPYWAGQLFDTYISRETLFGAIPDKIWNIENVYYRNAKPITEIAPARILWYASTDKMVKRSNAIIASSYLDEVMTDKPKKLFQKNKHYGIYEWKNIDDLCKKDAEKDIRALRFSNTEIFHKPIKLVQIRHIFIANGQKENTFTSPVKVGIDIFNQIYQLRNGENK